MIWPYLFRKWCYVHWVEMVRPEVITSRLCLLAVWLNWLLCLLCIIVTVCVRWKFMFTEQLEIRTLRQGITIVIWWTVLHFYSVKLGNSALVQCLHCSVVTEKGDKFSLLWSQQTTSYQMNIFYKMPTKYMIIRSNY